MSLLPAFAIPSNLPQQLSAALISSLWQGVLLVAVTTLLLRLLPQTSARFRFLVWTGVFLLLTALPVLNFKLASQTTEGVRSGPVQLDPRWSYALTALWLAAVAIRAVHLGVQATKLSRLWKSAVPVSGESLGNLPPLPGKVLLCTSAELDRPSVIGFFAPRILIPAWLFDQLTPAELHQIVLHELEHLRRRDDWLNLLQKLSLVIFPLNPALVWIDRRLATERELACDDGVLERTQAPRAYATCLTSLAERRLAHRREVRLTALALGYIGALRRSDLSRRIESILAGRSVGAVGPSRAVVVFAVAAMLGFAAAAARAPQLVSFSSSSAREKAVVSPEVQPAVLFAQPASTEERPRFVNASYRVAPGAGKADPPPAAKDDKGRAAMDDRGRVAVDDKLLRIRTAKAARKVIKPSAGGTVHTIQTLAPPQPEQQWMVLTSWHETAPVPVLISLPDGRTFLATYPATPTQVDWLLVQL